MQARLKVVQENANLKLVKLLPVTVIGRAAECQLKIASTQVSRRHCRITVTDKEVLVEDLNSANGTYVNQERLAPGKPKVVLPGTTLHIGPAAFEIDYTPPLTLETMPTTVIKASELPFLNGEKAHAPAEAAAVSPETLAEPSPATDLASENIAEAKSPAEKTAKQPVAASVVAEPVSAPPVSPAEKPALPNDTPVVVNAVKSSQCPDSSHAEQTVRMQSSTEDTLTAFSKSAPLSGISKGFDFLTPPSDTKPVADDLSSFHFATNSPANATAAKPAVPTAASSPASKKSLFGFFGKKEKPATTTSVPPAAPDAAPISLPPASQASDNPFALIEPAESSARSMEPPAPPSEQAATDDPFAFLK